MISVALTVATAIFNCNHHIVDIVLCNLITDNTVQSASLRLYVQEVQTNATLQIRIIETQECHFLYVAMFKIDRPVSFMPIVEVRRRLSSVCLV